MEAERIVIELKDDKMATLIVQPFDGDMDVEDILKIDYSNILGEILTFPVVFNRIANMRAEVSSYLAMAKLNLDIKEADLYDDHYKKLLGNTEKSRGPSIKDVEMAIKRDPIYQRAHKQLLQRQKDFEYLDSLYWSAQSKDKKLNTLSERITPEEFERELVEGKVNGIMIKMAKKAIPGVKKSR